MMMTRRLPVMATKSALRIYATKIQVCIWGLIKQRIYLINGYIHTIDLLAPQASSVALDVFISTASTAVVSMGRIPAAPFS